MSQKVVEDLEIDLPVAFQVEEIHQVGNDLDPQILQFWEEEPGPFWF